MRRSAVQGGLLLLALLTPPTGALADGPDELEAWVPSFSTYLGTLTQKGAGAINSSDVKGPPITEGGCLNTASGNRNMGLCNLSFDPLRKNTKSSDTGVSALVGGSIEVMSPRLTDVALSPRLFAHAGLSAAFGFKRNLAGEGRPGPFVPQELKPNQSDTPEIGVGGQGSRANTELQPLVVSAGAGVAFTTEVFDRRIRIKPSVEYMRQQIRLIGQLNRVVKLEQDNDPTDDPQLADFRQLVMRETDFEIQHLLGAGLEVETDSGWLGPFQISIFVHARGYRVIGDTDYTLSASNEFGESATWDFEFDPWLWRTGIGIRFRLVP